MRIGKRCHLQIKLKTRNHNKIIKRKFYYKKQKLRKCQIFFNKIIK